MARSNDDVTNFINVYAAILALRRTSKSLLGPEVVGRVQQLGLRRLRGRRAGLLVALVIVYDQHLLCDQSAMAQWSSLAFCPG